MNFPTDVTFTSLLQWMIAGGGAILVASWVLDRIPAFVKLPAETKKGINTGVSILLALAAYAILTYTPAEYINLIAPWFTVAMGVIVMISGQQAIHKLTKRS